MALGSHFSERIHPILGAIRTVPVPARVGEPLPPQPQRRAVPFVTISREVGSGAWTLAQKLVDALNADLPQGEVPWSCWDRELVEKVATDLNLSQRLIDSLWDSSTTWLNDFLSSLSFSNRDHHADEVRVVRAVAGTVRAMAQVGHVVLVGRGAVFVTRHMPGGVHVRLVAPLADRIAHLAEFHHVPQDQAAKLLKEMTRAREQFYHRYWPSQTLAPEMFAATLNTSLLSPDANVAVIRAMIEHAVQTADERR